MNLSAKEVARELHTDARTLRKFLRENLPKENLPGQGGRYVFTKSNVTQLRKAFNAWATPQPTQLDQLKEPELEQSI